MILELSRKFDKYDCVKELGKDVYSLENIITAHREGHHIFLPSESVIDMLIESRCFSRSQEATLLDIRRRYSSLSGFARDARFTTLVVPSKEPGSPAEASNQTRIVPLSDFRVAESVGIARLLCEDSDYDDGIIGLACDVQLKNFGYAQRPHYIPEHGAGLAIGRQYRRLVELGYPVLCVLDSDKKFPGDSPGDTFKHFLAEASGIGHTNQFDPSRLSEWRVLEVHEMENLIPNNIIEDACSAYPECVAHATDVAKIEGYSLTMQSGAIVDPIRYVDRKHGIRKKQANSNNVSEAEFAYKIWCIIESKPKMEDAVTRGEEYIIRSGGKTLLQNVISWCDRRSRYRKLHTLLAANDRGVELLDLAADLLTFAAGDMRAKERLEFV